MRSGTGLIRLWYWRAARVEVTFGPFQRLFTLPGSGLKVKLTLGDHQFTKATVEGDDAAGLPGGFKQPPTWSIGDSSVATITPAPDGLTCIVAATQPPKFGTTTVTVTDLDDPNVPVLTFDVEIVASPVTHLDVKFDTPQDLSALPTA